MTHFDTNRLSRIADWMQRYVDERKYAGSSLLVKHKGSEVFFNACGKRSVENDLDFQRDTVVRIYSMTKPITTVALMILAERGLFHLDAQLSEFLPEFSNMQALIPGGRAIGPDRGCPNADTASTADAYKRVQLSVQPRSVVANDG